jgi:polygalacturonase
MIKKRNIFIAIIAILSLAMVLFFIVNFNKKAYQQKEMPPAMFEIGQKPSFSNSCNILDYSAIQNEKANNTKQIQAAIDDCNKKGGGKVIIPNGKWLTGAIHLKSNIDLEITEDATLIFSTNPEDYLPAVLTRIEGVELYNYSPLIYTADAQNIAITGKGIIDGQGQAWMSWKNDEKKSLKKLYEMVKKNTPTKDRIFGYTKNGLRPSFIQFINCQNIWLEDFSIINSPRWTIHHIYSENIAMRNLKVNTTGFNTDGIVIDSSKNVLIENSTLLTGDDTIAIKSGLDRDGWRVNKPSENIIIRNTQINGGHSAIAMGSEMSGGIKNVFLSNLTINGADQGIRAKSMLGRGGIIENIWAKDINIGKVTNAGIKLDLTYDAATVESGEKIAPIFKNFYFENINIGETTVAISLDGLTESKITNVFFSNIKAPSATEGVFIKNSNSIHFKQTEINGNSGNSTFNIFDSKNIKY